MDMSAGTDEEDISKTEKEEFLETGEEVFSETEEEEFSETEEEEFSETEEFSEISDDYYKLTLSETLPQARITVGPSITTTIVITNFSSLANLTVKKCLKTSLFDFEGEHWRVLVYPGDPICVLLQKQSSLKEFCAECTLSFKKANDKVNVKRFTFTFGNEKDRFGCFFPSRRELMRSNPELAQSDLLTIYCLLMKGEPKGPFVPVPLYYMGFGILRHKKPFGFCDGLPRIMIPDCDEQEQVDAS